MNESLSTKGPLANFEEISSTETEDKLEELNNFLKCPICYSHFNTCMVTDCSHNFCSLCIRKYIQIKTECPICFAELYDSQLRPNRIVDTFVSILPELKDRLIRRIQMLKILKPNTLYISPAKNTDSPTATKRNVNKKRRILTENEDTPSKKEQTAVFVESGPCNPSKLDDNTPKITIPPIFQSPVKRAPTTPKNSSVPTYECPICSIDIPQTNINAHVDKCLERQQSSPDRKNAKETTKRAHLPKLVLRLMTTTALRAKAKEYGLNSRGDNDALKNRIQRFTVLYNAECDKVNPRSVVEIIRELEEEEKILSQKLPKSIFSLPDNSSSKEKLSSQYLKENKKSFDELVNIVRTRKTDKKLANSHDATSDQLSETSAPDPIYYGPSTSTYVPTTPLTYCDEENGIEVQEMKLEPVVQVEDVAANNESDDNGSEELFPVTRKRKRVGRLNFEESESSEEVVRNEIQFVSVKDDSDDAAFGALTDEDNALEKDKSSDDMSFILGDSPVLQRRSRTRRRIASEPTTAVKNLRSKKRKK